MFFDLFTAVRRALRLSVGNFLCTNFKKVIPNRFYFSICCVIITLYFENVVSNGNKGKARAERHNAEPYVNYGDHGQ